MGFSDADADKCAGVFAENTLDGVYSHGINRFPLFLQLIRENYIKVNEKPLLVNSMGSIEQWNGNLGAGILNALICTDRAIELASETGMGCVALSNTNHWMRGGTYGWRAAKRGYVFMAWTNTIPNMPAWGAKDIKLGNNPFVIAVPYKDEAIVLDMAMSQFSYGKMEDLASKGLELSVPGGYNVKNELTQNPSEILDSLRPLPIGYWKGAGLSLLLDLLATVLSGGISSHKIGEQKVEAGVSQVFVALNLNKLSHFAQVPEIVNNIIDDFKKSQSVSNESEVYYPGERSLRTRIENLAKGIPVDESFWNEILNL